MEEINLSQFNQQPEQQTPTKLPPHRRLAAWHKNLSKKQKLALLGVVVLLIAGACWLTLKILNEQPRSANNVQNVNKQTKVPSDLTGLLVEPSVNKRQVTGVIIENSLDARPQSGLAGADVVFEAVAEGGITRFLALYQDSAPASIGPIRSVRPYYLHWLAPFDASIAHVGGSPSALSLIRKQNIKDLDQFYNPAAYTRVPNRFAPHNVFSSLKKLQSANKQRGYQDSEFKGFVHDRRERPAETPKIKRINVNYSTSLYQASFRYDKKSNSYKRSMQGVGHRDSKTKKVISPKAVVVLIMQRSQSGIYSVYDTTGSGRMLVFQNGTVTKGTWQKKNLKSQFKFTNSKKEPIKLAPGQTWVSIAEAGRVNYK